jgi:uncharacterized protein (TIGR04255 family)
MADNKATIAVPRLPSYENAPLNELAIGIHFEQLAGWQSRHVGQFWTEVAKEFPSTEDQTPIFEVEGGPRFQILQLPPLRRTFLVSQDQNFVLQLQESRFLLNWRKRQPKDTYPRFGSVFARFIDHWGHFSDFVAREKAGNLKPVRYELTYVNHIEQGESPVSVTAERYARIFNWSNLKSQFLPPPTGVNVVWTFPLPSQLGFAQANLSQGVRTDGRAVLVLVMSCNGSASPKTPLNEWFATAHQWLSEGFKELTTEIAHKEWGYKE